VTTIHGASQSLGERRAIRFLVTAVVLGLALLGCAAADRPAQPTPIVIAVDLHQWAVGLDRPSVPAGVPVRLVATNTGTITHSLFVAGPNAQAAALAPGEKATLDLVFSQPGTFTLFCPIGGGSHRQVGMEASLKVTEGPAGGMAAPIPTALPTPTTAPLTAFDATIDHVGFPVGYRERFAPFFENERASNRDVHVAYINAVGASARADRPFPYGTVIALDIYPALLTTDGQIARDSGGHFLRGDLAMIFVMRKERGLGAKYGVDRTGEWEYADYKPDGTYDVAPQLTQTCAECHIALSNARQDWLIGADRFFAQRRQRGEGEGTASADDVSVSASVRSLIPIGLAVGAPLLVLAVLGVRTLGHRWETH
jgi:hypothetical protein